MLVFDLKCQKCILRTFQKWSLTQSADSSEFYILHTDFDWYDKSNCMLLSITTSNSGKTIILKEGQFYESSKLVVKSNLFFEITKFLTVPLKCKFWIIFVSSI